MTKLLLIVLLLLSSNAFSATASWTASVSGGTITYEVYRIRAENGVEVTDLVCGPTLSTSCTVTAQHNDRFYLVTLNEFGIEAASNPTFTYINQSLPPASGTNFVIED